LEWPQQRGVQLYYYILTVSLNNVVVMAQKQGSDCFFMAAANKLSLESARMPALHSKKS
jgi:hypothetical protein